MTTNCSTVSTVVLTSTESEIEFFHILLMGVISLCKKGQSATVTVETKTNA